MISWHHVKVEFYKMEHWRPDYEQDEAEKTQTEASSADRMKNDESPIEDKAGENLSSDVGAQEKDDEK